MLACYILRPRRPAVLYRLLVVNGAGRQAGHVFISYAREDRSRVDDLQKAFEAAGIPVWRDTNEIRPGGKWRAVIQRAIREETLVFIACFSKESVRRRKGYQNEELTLAIEELRLRRPDQPWLIPVRFDACDIPDLEIGGGHTLESIHHVDVFGPDAIVGTVRLVTAVQQILGSHGDGRSGGNPFGSGGWDVVDPPAVEPPAVEPPAVEPPAVEPPPVDRPPVVPPPTESPSRPAGWAKRNAIAVAATGALCVIGTIVLVLSALADSPPKVVSPPKPRPISLVRVPHGCPAQVGGLNHNELVGFVNSSCFPADPAMAKVASEIEAQNPSISGSAPYRTVVFLGVMSSSTSGGANPASLFQLRGVLYAQRQQNQKNSKFKIRVLLANAADEFQAGPVVSQLISKRVLNDPSIVAVLGIGQSRTFALNSIQELGKLDLPVIGTSVTGEQMAGNNFFRISPKNERQAQLAALFAKSLPKVRKVLVLANQNKDIHGKNQDLYSDNLADWFRHHFTDSSHSIIEVCDYGEQEDPAVSCGGRSLSIPQLRERICSEKPDLIFFAARAETLPQLFTTPGGTCDHLPPVLGSSDVPKYADITSLRTEISKYGSQLYYLSFAPAKLGGCHGSAPKQYQTKPMCAFLAGYRSDPDFSGPLGAVGGNPGDNNAGDNNAGLSYDSSDAMLGYDALETIFQVIDVTGRTGIDRSGVLQELNSGKIAFNGASGYISFSAQNRTSPNHPVYVTSLGTTLTLKVSCGRFSDASDGKDGRCPTIP
jgi:ABC-type branched-subunit amino acid transport system substrate-binding protein